MPVARNHGGGAPRGTIDFSVPRNPLPHPPWLRDLLASCIEEGVYSRYPSPGLEEERRAALTLSGYTYLDAYVANGSSDILALLPLAAKPPSIVFLEPTFGDHGIQSRVWGPTRLYRVKFMVSRGRVEPPPPWSLEPLLHPGSMIVVSSPNNPTGYSLSYEYLRALEDLTEDRGSSLIIDVAFQDLSLAPRFRPRRESSYVLWSPTKSLATPGLRFGALIGWGPLLELLDTARQPWPIGGVESCFYRRLAQELLDEAREYMSAGARLAAREAPRIMRELSSLGLEVYPTSTVFLLVRHPGMPHPVMQRMLATRGVWVRDASSFYGLGPEYSRVSVRLPWENRLLLDAFRGVVNGP